MMGGFTVRIATVMLVLVLAAPAAAQERPRGSVGVAMLHSFSAPWLGVDTTVRTGPVDTQFTYFRLTEFDVYDYDGYYEESRRVFDWFSAGVIWPFPGVSGRIRPHLLGGYELFKDTSCDRMSADQSWECGPFPHYRPGVHVGLGVDVPIRGRFFARVQYLSSVIFVYERAAVGHRLRVSAGLRF